MKTLQIDEIKKLLEEEGLIFDEWVQVHKRLFKMGKIEFYKVENKLKFYFRWNK